MSTKISKRYLPIDKCMTHDPVSDSLIRDILGIKTGVAGEALQEELDSMIGLAVYDFIEKEIKEIEKTQHRNPEYDFDFKIQFYFLKDKILAFVMTEEVARRRAMDFWESLEGVEYYGYWNNTDMPDDISEEEWDQRGKDWDEALSEHIIGMTGVGVDCVCFQHRGQFFSEEGREKMNKEAPTIEERSKVVAHKIVEHYYFGHKFKEKTDEIMKTQNGLFSHVRKITDIIKSEDGQKRLKAVQEKVREALIPDLTSKDVWCKNVGEFYIEQDPLRFMEGLEDEQNYED